MKKVFLIIFAMMLCISGNVFAEESENNTSAVEVPYMVSLRSSKVNARSGPGPRYPIEWIYLQKDSPLEVVSIFEDWRKVKDWQNSESWIHKSMLSTKRTVKVVTLGENNIYAKADRDSKVIAKVEDDVVGEVKKCNGSSNFCLIKFGSVEGWIAKNNLFGVRDNETIN